MQKKRWCVIWILAILLLCFGNMKIAVHAEETEETGTGVSEREAITLPLGKARYDSLSKESSARWFKIQVEEDGILKVALW